MDPLVSKLRALAEARTEEVFTSRYKGLEPLLERAQQAAPTRGAAARGAQETGQLVPALAAALVTGLRLTFPERGRAVWRVPAGNPATTAAMSVGRLAGAFSRISGMGISGLHALPAGGAAALMQLLRQTELIPLIISACATLARAPAASGGERARVTAASNYSCLCLGLASACLDICRLAAGEGEEEQAAAACLQAADVVIHLLSTCYRDWSAPRVSMQALESAAKGLTVYAVAATHDTIGLMRGLQPLTGDGEPRPPAPGSFARTVLLDPGRRVQRLAAAQLAYSLQGDVAAMGNTSWRAEAQQRMWPQFTKLLAALELPPAPDRVLSSGGWSGVDQVLAVLSHLVEHQNWCCPGIMPSGATSLDLLPVPPSACAPLGRVLVELLAVSPMGSEREAAVLPVLTCLAAQMSQNLQAVEAASVGWAAGLAGALFEVWVGKAHAGGGSGAGWQQRGACFHAFAMLASASGAITGSISASMEQHAAAHPAEFCSLLEGGLRRHDSVDSGLGSGLLLCLAALSDGSIRDSLLRAAAASFERVGPRASSLMVAALKRSAAELRRAEASPLEAATLADAVAALAQSTTQQASTVVEVAGSARSLHTSPATWASLTARALVLAGRAMVAAAAMCDLPSAGNDAPPAADEANSQAPRVAALLSPKLPALCSDLLSQLRACGRPRASGVDEELEQQSQAIATEAAALTALLSMAAAGGCDSEAARCLDELGAQLEAFGAAVCAQLPLRSCCNSHACENLGAASEEALVKGTRCTGCGAAAYCSKECQKGHWAAWHKDVCKALRS